MAERNLNTAEIILQQLGGRQFIAMTGASSFSGNDKFLTFRLPARITKNKGSAMRITLEPNDSYKLELLKMRKFEIIVIDVRNNIYVESLRDTFSDMTGLRSSLNG